jgi:Lsr2
MVSKTIVLLISDLSETDADESVSFALDGVDYEIDLTTDEAAKLRESLAEYVAVARRVTASRKPATRRTTLAPTTTSKEERATIRAWAAANGFRAPAMGRIPEATIAAYHEAH